MSKNDAYVIEIKSERAFQRIQHKDHKGKQEGSA